MRIRTNIFVWVFLATIVPLTALALGATYYSEANYQRTATESMKGRLDRLYAELNRYLESYTAMADGMVRSQAVQELLPALAALKRGDLSQDFNIQRSRVNHFFEGFQNILPGTYFLRILDSRGNTIIKVSHQSRSAPIYESLNGVSYVEEEINDKRFAKLLRQLPKGEVSAIRLPHNRKYPELYTHLQLRDYVVPLYYKKQFLGALSMTLFGEQLDQAARNATRKFDGNVFIVQHSPEQPKKHGMLLFDWELGIFFIQRRTDLKKVGQYYEENFMEKIGEWEDGEFASSDGRFRYYYREIHPYGDQLNRWMLVHRIESTTISEPFNRIRIVIWLCASIALVVSLLLASIGTRKVARPICELAGKLLTFASGNYQGRIKTHQGIDEIDSLTDAFNYMADTLQRTRDDRDQAQNMMLQNAKLASIGQMAAGIGHELNNPLNNILSYAKLIERGVADNDTASKDVRSLREEVVRASGIVKGILNFARQVPPEYSSFAVPKWLEDTHALVNQMAKTAGVSINLINEYEGEIEGDRGQLQQVMVNLLLNAIQASPRDSEIEVLCRQDEDKLGITVQDHGHGIEKDVLDRIYDPFFTTKPEGEGSGLGLSISLGIVERHGGKLNIVPAEGNGVCATITLPLQANMEQ